MKNNTYFGRRHLFRWLLLFWLAIPCALQAQTATHITSNSQVGCKDYRGDKEDEFQNNVSSETIESSPCVKVCSGSVVIYTANGQNIANVQWSASGGTVGTISGSGNTVAEITWGAVGSGSVQALITYANGTIETQTVCINKINSPIAEFSMMNIDRSVCKNTPILFDNTSQNNGGAEIVSYFWDFGDNSATATSTAFEPSHAFAQAGNYEVHLTVTNKCGCSNTYSLPVEVLESPPVQINCASVVCEGSIEKYNVQDGCKDGEWKVIGGTIVANNGNEIEVKWDQVDPADGFGYVMYRSQCGCREWTTIKIPVILTSGQIQGPSTVCANTQYKYSLPQWPTTNFQWNMSGPSGGQLIYNQQRNEVIFKASQPGTYTLWCSYLNTLLQCEGYASMTITVEEPVVISGGSAEICVGTDQTFTATPNVPVIWTVTSGSSVVYTSSPTTLPFTYPFATAGFFTVSATKQGGGCESNGISVKVIAPPGAPTGTIFGDDKVCAGKPYVYTLNPLDSGVIPVWEVTNGTIQGSNTGSSVTVIFNAGATSYEVSVRNRSLDTAGCLSTPITKAVELINLDTITPNLNPGPFCPSSTQSFSVNLNGIVPDSMEWSFDHPNFGSFVSGQGTANITVNFNEISTTADTKLNLKIIKCGIEQIIQIPVSLLTLPVVNFTNVNPICLGSNLSFTIDQGIITSATQVTFTFANNSTYPATFDASGVYTFANNNYIQNNSGANVNQSVTVTYTGTNGCNYEPTATANFTVYPETIITVSPVYNITVCDPSSITPYVLTANSSTGLTNTTGWQWIKDGADIPGATTNSYTLSGAGMFGTYKVRAIDQNGCTVYSQNIIVTQDCPTNNCVADPQISFTPTWTSCNTINVSNLSYIGTPDEIQWGSDGVLTLVSPQGSSTATYQTNLAGAHIVMLRLRYGSCWYSAGIEVQKKYEPKFNISTVCNGNGYNLTLHNTSTIFNLTGPVSYSFDGLGQPTQYGQTASYNNLAPGTYSFTMTMSAPGYPSCTTTQTVTLAAVPDVNFTYPTQACLGEVITLTVPGAYSPDNTYTWIFDGTSYVTSSSTADITFNNDGNKTIKLKITTPNGCVYESQFQGIYINVANFTGSYLPFNPIGCVGSGPGITVVSSPNAAGYIWMNGSNQVPGAPDSPTFTPTQSGSYWPILISNEGCKSYAMSANQASVTLQNTPYVNISAKSNICAGQSVTLTGIVTDNTLEYRWGVNAPPSGTWSSSPYPITYVTGGLAAGTYTYYLEVRPAGTTTGCVGSKNFTVTVSNLPPTPAVTYTLQNCQPYEVVLTASGPAAGQYNWSNGMTGQSIVVNEGGAYEVIYTAPSGCKVSSQVQVPLSIESLIWVFPTGCYDECRGDRYIIGPKGVFDSHQWQMFGANVQSGVNDYIYPLFMNNAGTYQLQINQFGCTYTSGTMNFYQGIECGIEQECKFEAAVEGMKWDVDHYILQGVINNFGGQPMTITISSLNGYGSYIHSIITIPAGGTYDMFTNPIAFYPNSTYPGGADEILFNAGNGCQVIAKVEIPNYITKSAGSKSAIGEVIITASSLKIFPNPAKEKVRVSYNTGDEKQKAKQLKVFDAMGNVKFSKELKTASGEVDIEIDGWMQGMYIVIIHTDGKPLQGKLLKK